MLEGRGKEGEGREGRGEREKGKREWNQLFKKYFISLDDYYDNIYIGMKKRNYSIIIIISILKYLTRLDKISKFLCLFFLA